MQGGVEWVPKRVPMLNRAVAAGSGAQSKTVKDQDMEKRKRILYIEDETDLQWLVRHILQSIGGFDVMVCSSGAEGLRVIKEFNPDLILLDVMMPEMDGFSVLRALRVQPETAAVPVVFLTARTQQGDEYLALGVNGVIAKPFEPGRLVEQVRAYTVELVAA